MKAGITNSKPLTGNGAAVMSRTKEDDWLWSPWGKPSSRLSNFRFHATRRGMD